MNSSNRPFVAHLTWQRHAAAGFEVHPWGHRAACSAGSAWRAEDRRTPTRQKIAVAVHASRAKLRAMHPCVPRLCDQFGPICPEAANDNLPAESRPRKLRQALASMFDKPMVFFLYIFLIGFVCTTGYSLALGIAFQLK